MIKNKVVLVPFPFDDFSTTKVRPAVCLTEPIGSYGHLILAFISSQTPADLFESDLLINSEEADFTETGLRVTSTLRLHRLMTVTSSIIRRELGVLSPRLQLALSEKLRQLFGLTEPG